MYTCNDLEIGNNMCKHIHSSVHMKYFNSNSIATVTHNPIETDEVCSKMKSFQQLTGQQNNIDQS